MQKMSNYYSKFITFLCNGNLIKVNNKNEFQELVSAMMRVGIDISNLDYDNLLKNVKDNAIRRGKTYMFGDSLVCEFTNGKGFTTGWNSLKEVVEWFGEEPFEWKEIKTELRA